MSDIAPGDVVICICAEPLPGDPKVLVERALYTVTDIKVAGPEWDDAGEVGFLLAEVPPLEPDARWAARRFRKLFSPDKEVTREVIAEIKRPVPMPGAPA